MCGLTGFFATPGSTAADVRAAVERMLLPIAHRGPDDAGIWTDPAGVALGFRRLAIIDLSPRGHQPMRSASGRFTMVFNGETYNFRELRAELEREGARFAGHSDSEVMLAAFERWGVRPAVERFVGMFAIALWDAERRALTLIRDRLGKKPLYVYARPGYVGFASELKALAAGPQFDAMLDRDALAAYLRYRYIPAPLTVYRHVRKLEAGCLLEIADPTAPLPDPVRYWSLREVALAGVRDRVDMSDDELVSETERLLADAARRRMIADVPLGAFLSGGIDSSTVVALMQAGAERPVRTFSVAFREADYDEAAHAARVARHLGTDHTEVRLTDDDACAIVPRLPDLFDEPLADAGQLPTFLICQTARRELTVAVSGDGGDEVFAGYNRYVSGERWTRFALRVPASARRAAAAGIDAVGPAGWDRVHAAVAPALPRALRHRLPGEKAAKLAGLLRAGNAAAMYRDLLSAWREPAALVPGAHEPQTALEQAFATPGLDLLERMLLTDQLHYLPDDLLAKVDRVSMAVSLEVRVPLLDHRLVEWSWRLPRRAKVRQGTGKWILRRILHRHVPPGLVERPKMGFSVPIDRWLRGALRSWAEALLDETRLRREGVLDGGAVRAAWTRLQAGDARPAHGLWSVLVLQAWLERWRPVT
jgi:asparagine synthase (glutamine-hydrolysing)